MKVHHIASLKAHRKTITFAVVIVSALIFIGIIFWQNTYDWRTPFIEGNKLESQRQFSQALERYRSIRDTPDDVWVDLEDFIARDLFMTGKIQEAIDQYNARAMTFSLHAQHYRYVQDCAALSIAAQKATEVGNYQKVLALADEMIGHSKILNAGVRPILFHPYSTLDPEIMHKNIHNLYSGSSEGYIRKYDALIKLERLNEADDLRYTYYNLVAISLFQEAHFAPRAVQQTPLPD